MKQKISIILSTLILILPIALYAIFKTPANSNIAVAAEINKPVVLEFSSPMCSECQKLQKVLTVVEPKYADKIEFEKINAALPNEETVNNIKKYNVKVVPTTIFINTDGKAVAKVEGSMTESRLEYQLKALLK